ncbi:unnamed protein product [Camellia sinensis]
MHELRFFLNVLPPNTWDCSINSKALELFGPYQPQARSARKKERPQECSCSLPFYRHTTKNKNMELSIHALPIPDSTKNMVPEVTRRSANYHPSIWGNHFLAYATHAVELDGSNDDLYTIALLFRLLRQQGYPISSDVFYEFKDDNGKILESLIRDVRGMLSLYEAAHLRLAGDDILDEALSFTITHLEFAVPNLSNLVQEQVIHALNQPIHKGLTRLEATRYFFFFEQDDSHNKVLLNFAKLDFNLLEKKCTNGS